MADPFLAEIRMFSFTFAPKGWAVCDGQEIPILQNQALFALLGTVYGGNGSTTFELPNFQGRVPVSTGPGFEIGRSGGAPTVAIDQQTMPLHAHTLSASSAMPDTPKPATNASPAAAAIWAPPGGNVPLDPRAVTPAGGSLPHENRQPFLTVLFCIATMGLFPSPN